MKTGEIHLTRSINVVVVVILKMEVLLDNKGNTTILPKIVMDAWFSISDV